MVRFLPLLLSLLLGTGSVKAVVVNAYAQVVGIAGTVLTIGVFDETNSLFQPGGQLVLMQMQDNVIGGFTANNSSFGNLGGIQQAGHHIICPIASVNRVGMTLVSIDLVAPPSITFNFGPNSAVQAVSYELLGGGGDYTTTQQIDAYAWDGAIGGVVAFEVTGTLTLQHNILANSNGFRPGIRTTAGGGGFCNTGVWYSVAGLTHAGKGEGIQKVTNLNWAAARAKIINGGGGGNGHNGGGGGGANFSAGGMGGPGYNCNATPVGGHGGIALSGVINSSRIFLGGGGGGGEGNNNLSSNGGRGGGIIMIEADTIRTVGSCGGRIISANGSNAPPTLPASGGVNDGAGGGGAGGSIVLEVDGFDISPNCPLTIRANGGNGGSILLNQVRGAGGGGGQGVIIFSGPVPVSPNIIIQTNNGLGGCNTSVLPCTFSAASGGGTDGSGILGGDSGPMPIELLAFSAAPLEDDVEVRWTTATEMDNEWFDVERSVDGVNWLNIARLPGAGNSIGEIHYTTIDPRPHRGLSYYRLRQTDFDGQTTLSQIVSVYFEPGAAELSIFPNPTNDRLNVVVREDMGPGVIHVVNGLGQIVMELRGMSTVLDVSRLPSGTYSVVYSSERTVVQERLMIQR